MRRVLGRLTWRVCCSWEPPQRLGPRILCRTLSTEPLAARKPARPELRRSSRQSLCGLFVAATFVALLVGCTHSWRSREPEATVGIPSETAQASLTMATAAPMPAATATPALAARVSGQPILMSEYEQELAAARAALLEQDTDPTTEGTQGGQADLEQQVLEHMIDQVLVSQAAEELGIVLDGAEVDTQVRADVLAGGGSLAFAAWLTATGQTSQEYSAAVRASLLLQRVALAVTVGLPSEGEQVHLRQIEVSSRDVAEGILAQVRQGEDLAKLAADLALPARRSTEAGDIGWIPRGVLDPSAEAVVFALVPGEVSGVVALDNGGYALYQVIERSASRQFSLAVQAELRTAAFRQWLAEKRANAVVERWVGP
jgi:foldase protein PrsA